MQMFGSDGKLQYWKELDPQLHVSGPCLSKVRILTLTLTLTLTVNPDPDPDPNPNRKP